MVEPNNKIYTVFERKLPGSNGGGEIGMMLNGQPVKYSFKQEMVHIVTIDGQEYVVRGDDAELRDNPQVIETGGS